MAVSIKKCPQSRRLVSKLHSMNTLHDQGVNITLVKKAICFAKLYHGSQIRQSGEPYYTHPIEVTIMVADYLYETNTIIAALLHDTLEDTTLTYEEIRFAFNQEVADYVEGLTRIKPHGKISSAELLEDLWNRKQYKVMLIKLFDRLHNLETIFVKSPEKQMKIIQESLDYFVGLGAILEKPWLSEEVYTKCCQAQLKLDYMQNFSRKSQIYELPQAGHWNKLAFK